MTTSRRTSLLLGLAAFALASTPLLDPMVSAAPPASIRVQGSLSDRSGGPPVPANGIYAMKFSLYDNLAGGTLVASAGPTNITVLAGLYNADVPFPPSTFAGPGLFLEVAINGEILAPRIPVVSVPYAYESGQASAVVPGAIVSASLAPGAVATANLAPGAVTADKLGIPCGDGQILIRSGALWVCSAPPLQVVCNPNDFISCYDGPEATIGVGTCRIGRRACAAGGTGFGPCTAQTVPSTEVGACDGLDNDCDGSVDDACAICGNGAVEPAETCDDLNMASLDGCSATCQTEPGFVCAGQPSACVFQCAPVTANCDGVLANGCECQSATCCGGGACATVHQNGLGQPWENCGPPGIPGNPATYTLDMAVTARAAWNASGSDFSIADYCGSSQSVVLRQAANSCAVWIYTGALAGHVRLNTTNASCLCPVTNTFPMWY